MSDDIEIDEYALQIKDETEKPSSIWAHEDLAQVGWARHLSWLLTWLCGGVCLSLRRVDSILNLKCIIYRLYSILAVKLTRIAWFSAISPSILNRFSSNFAKAIFYSNPNSPDNFVKLYSVFQKLDHLSTCNELKLRRSSLTPLNYF